MRRKALVGRLVICVANLAPRQMKFGLSEGNGHLPAAPAEKEVFLPVARFGRCAGAASALKMALEIASGLPRRIATRTRLLFHPSWFE